MSWTDERVELLKKLWSEGFSASQISGRIGGVSRNAVISKVHRLGLSGRVTPSRMKHGRVRARTDKTDAVNRAQSPPSLAQVGNPALRALHQADAETFVPSQEELVIPIAERKTIATLEPNHCRWPIGDPQHADFHFCGKDKFAGLPYCEFHARRAFQSPSVRKPQVKNTVEIEQAVEDWKRRKTEVPA